MKQQDVVDVEPLPDYTEIKQLRKSDLHAWVEKRQSLKAHITLMEAEAKELSTKIETLLVTAKVEKVRAGDYRVSLCISHTASKLSKERLVELGVSPKVIQKATIEGQEYQYVKVSAIKEATE